VGPGWREDRPSGPSERPTRSRIIDETPPRAVPIDTTSTLLDDIRTMLAMSEQGVSGPSLAAMEDILTTGYAQAMQLEAERWRLERQVDEVTARIARGAADAGDRQLAKLARRMSKADADLSVLRRALRDLRDRASALRAA
jgi:hypothetical protein